MNIKEYWNNKHPKKPIIYAGRAIRRNENRINVDVRNMIWEDDRILQEVIDDLKGSNDEKAHSIQSFVASNIKYVGDQKNSKMEECWQFPNETLITRRGDCEDGAILIASLLLNAGIPEWRVRVTAGLVKAGKAAETGGHAYVTYCRETDNNWVILDWCYLADVKLDIKSKPLMKDVSEYKDIWFSFNNKYSWSHKEFGVIKGVKN